MIFAIIAGVVGLFIWGRLPVMLVALMVPLALFFSGILPLNQVFSGFGDTVIIFIASLFVVAAGLEASGVTAWVGQWLSRAVGSSPLKLSIFTVLIAALLSPLISQSGAVAALVPVVSCWPSHGKVAIEIPHAAGFRVCRRIEAGADRHAKNVLVSDAASDAGYGQFGFFEFAWVGVPLLLGTVLIVAIWAAGCCPSANPPTCLRTSASMPAH